MSLEFSGADASNSAVEIDSTKVANVLSTTGQALSIEVIFKYQTLDGSGGFPHLYGGDGSTGGKHWQLWIGTSGKLSARFICGGTQYNTPGNLVASANTIHHYFVVYRGDKIDTYLDGEFDSTIAATGNLDALTAFWIGDNPTLTPREFDGHIYRMRVWHRKFNANRIRNASKGNDRSASFLMNLVAFWEFADSPVGTQLSNGSYDVMDSSGNGVVGRAAHATNRPYYGECFGTKRRLV